MRFFFNGKAFSLTEIMIAVVILAVVLAGMMEMFLVCEQSAIISSATQLALLQAQSKIEEIKNTPYASIVANYAQGGSVGNTFNLNGLNGLGNVSIDNSIDHLLKISVNVTYSVAQNRVIGGSLGPINLVTYIAEH